MHWHVCLTFINAHIKCTTSMYIVHRSCTMTESGCPVSSIPLLFFPVHGIFKLDSDKRIIVRISRLRNEFSVTISCYKLIDLNLSSAKNLQAIIWFAYLGLLESKILNEKWRIKNNMKVYRMHLGLGYTGPILIECDVASFGQQSAFKVHSEKMPLMYMRVRLCYVWGDARACIS